VELVQEDIACPHLRSFGIEDERELVLVSQLNGVPQVVEGAVGHVHAHEVDTLCLQPAKTSTLQRRRPQRDDDLGSSYLHGSARARAIRATHECRALSLGRLVSAFAERRLASVLGRGGAEVRRPKPHGRPTFAAVDKSTLTLPARILLVTAETWCAAVVLPLRR
jgi:hypothetical protein